MTSPLDDLLNQYEAQLNEIRQEKEKAKQAYEIASKNEDRFLGAMLGVKDAQAQLLSTKSQTEEITPKDAEKAKN
mgnify:FL=1|tara:strand:+ start:207 stop:431 length:225 start_codon:yes stop_codon:yes gene_type:complete